MSKKHLAVAAVAVLALSSAACSSGSKTSGGAKHWKVTLIAGTTADNFYVTMNCGAQEEARKLGVTYQFTGPNHFDAPALDKGFEARLVFVQDCLRQEQPRHATAHEHLLCQGVDHLRKELDRLEPYRPFVSARPHRLPVAAFLCGQLRE